MSAPDAVLFDLDGVLVHSYEAWFHLLQGLARELATEPVTRERFAAGWGQGIQADVRDFFPALSVTELERLYADRFLDHADHLRVEPAASTVFARLSRRYIPIAVVTNTPSPLARKILEAAQLAPDFVVGGTDVAAPKPAPDMILRACALVGVDAARALVVGDSRYDRDAARAAGARFAGFGGIEGDWTLTSLDEIPWW